MTGEGSGPAIILLARSAIAATPLDDMKQMGAAVAARHPDAASVAYAFSEQGTPYLRDVIAGIARSGVRRVLVVPLLLPMEPGFVAALTRRMARWAASFGDGWPEVRLTPPPARAADLGRVIDDLIAQGDAAKPLNLTPPRSDEGSVVPAQKRRILLCQDGPCLAEGAAQLWAHLRNEQHRLALKTTGEGTMSAKTSCLGPCNLASVAQVWPEGTYYGGLDEDGIDRIIDQHLLHGRVVESLAYHPGGGKQRLRR